MCWALTTSAPHTSEIAFGSLLPTPTCAGNDLYPSMQKHRSHRNLAHWLPTLGASDGKGPPAEGFNVGGRFTAKLAMDRGMLPTPTATLYGSNGDPRDHAAGVVGKRRASLETLAGGIFNALREWMMGWPIGWTALEPLATGRFLQWLDSHGKR